MFLGVDVGTSAVKAVLVDDDQALVAQASSELTVTRPRPGWSEQDPEDWWRATQATLAALRSARPAEFAAVRGLGLAGQMHGAVLIDRDGAAVRPAILWDDGRAVSECRALLSSEPAIPEIAGVPPMPGFTAPKLLWLRRHEPDALARMAMVVSPKDYVRMKLTGDRATDVSDAAGTLWLDEAARNWSASILRASGLTAAAMPALYEGSAATGFVLPALQAEWGAARRIVVAGGAGDAAAAAVGVGAIEDGDSLISLGTSGQLFVTTDSYRPAPAMALHSFAHALPGRWYVMAAMLNGAACLQWLAGLLGEPDVGAMVAKAEAGFRGPADVLFLPYLSGERTPHDDPQASGGFFGLHSGTRREALVQAALEGVMFSFLDAQSCLAAAGVVPTRVAAVGGGARSRFWMGLFASGLGAPITRYAGAETGPAFGAARLARMAATGEPAAAVCLKPPVAHVSEPDAALHAAYRERLPAFRRLYRVEAAARAPFH